MPSTTGMKEYWVLHRPRHPLWGTIMYGSTGATLVASPVTGTVSVYTGDEKDYLFYKYNGGTFAVTEKPWLLHTASYSMVDAVTAAKRLMSYVGQENVRIMRVINGTLTVTY